MAQKQLADQHFIFLSSKALHKFSK